MEKNNNYNPSKHTMETALHIYKMVKYDNIAMEDAVKEIALTIEECREHENQHDIAEVMEVLMEKKKEMELEEMLKNVSITA